MKKFFTLIALALAAVSANAQATFSASGQWNDTDDVTVETESGKAAGRTGKILLKVENDEPIQAVQFKVVIPEGFDFRNSKTNYFINKGDEYKDRYSAEGGYMADVEDEDGEVIGQEFTPFWTCILAAAMSDGSTYIPISNNPDIFTKHPEAKSYMLPAGSGAIGHFEVRVPADFEGPATVTFKDVVYTDKDGNSVDAPDFTAQLVKVSTEISTAIDRVDAQTLTGKEIYNLSGQRVSKPSQRGIYIVDGKKIMVK